MIGFKNSRLQLRRMVFLLLILPGFWASAGCNSEPSTASDLPDWLAAGQANSSSANEKTNEITDKPVPSKTGPHPKIEAPETDFQFGQMRVGTHMQHEFRILNKGEAPLKLVAGKPTCKCTQFEVSPSEVPPGESATLKVEWHGKDETTSFQHGGLVHTNDPLRPSIRFNVGGTVDATLVTQPEGFWDAGDVPGDDPISFQGIVISRFLPELTITNVTNTSESVSVDYEKMTDSQLGEMDAQSGWKIRVTVRPDFPVGRLDDTLKVTVAEVDELLEIPVVAQRQGDIRFVPMRGTSFNPNTRTLNLGQFPVSRGRTGDFMLLVNTEVFPEELEILEVESSPKSLKLNLEPIGKPAGTIARYKVTVKVPQGGLREEKRKDSPATIRCLTNHTTEPEILLKLVYSAF